MDYTNHKMVLDWNEYRKTAIEAASEGAVLIKNDGALPVAKGAKVALFGRMQANYYKSGTGSGGMVNVDHVVDIREGLNDDPDVELDQELIGIYDEWEKENPVDPGIGWGNEKWSQAEMPLTDELVERMASKNDVAIMIIARTAGEDRDNTPEKGSFYLTDGEEDMLSKVCKNFKNTIVLLNVGNIIDMSFVTKYNPSAVMYVWQAGMIGGTAAANLVTGKATPSGCLTDTIAFNLSDHPSDENFGNKDPMEDLYCEDIYVGYRYFSTFAPEKVMYPFGFGLSYTTFELSNPTFENSGTDVKAAITVKNTGDVAGKKVVMLFASAPEGKLAKSKMVLVGYAKTNTLAPNEEETLEITTDATEYASYDDDGRLGLGTGWMLEKGAYEFYIGENVRDNVKAGGFELADNVVVESLKSALAPVTPFKRMTVGGAFEDTPLRKVQNVENRSEYMPAEIPQTGNKGIKLADVMDGKNTMDEFIAQLDDEELALIIRGEGMSSPKVTTGTAAAFGGVTKELMDMGIPPLCCDDGPSGMRIDSGKKAFALPNGTCLASTFNDAMNTKLFEIFGMEMIINQVDTILGPGMNIHRHPLNGRNFEYFSEDPYLTGHIAAAQVNGLEKNGVTATIKHFCVNNREKNRRHMNSVVSEKALREIYLKGFEIAVKKANARSIMSVYNKINGEYGTSCYDLHTVILREQWGYKGIVMTDWWAYINYVPDTPYARGLREHSIMARAQCDLYMTCSSVARDAIDEADTYENIKNGRTDLVTRAELQRCARNIVTFAMNTPAMARVVGKPAVVEQIDRPFHDDSIEVKVDKFYKVDDGVEIPVNVNTAIGEDFTFGCDCTKIGKYKFELIGSSDLDPLAQIPMTVKCSGIPFKVVTWNGTNGEEVTMESALRFLSRYTTVRIHFGNGVSLKKIRITYECTLEEGGFDW